MGGIIWGKLEGVGLRLFGFGKFVWGEHDWRFGAGENREV